MVKFDGNDITVTQGDTLVFTLVIDGAEEGNTVLFTVKARTKDTAALFRQEVSADANGKATFCMESSDTRLPAKTYVWDARLIIPHEGEENEVRTPMEYASFTVLEAVGDV